MRTAVLLVTMVAFVAGCLGDAAQRADTYKDRTITAVIDSGVAPANRTGDQFYLVLISGLENVRKIAGEGEAAEHQCATARTVEYDVGGGVVWYDPDVHPLDKTGLQMVVALDYRGDGVVQGAIGRGCASKSTIAGFDGRAAFNFTLRTDVTIDLVGEPQNGFLTYNRGYFFPIGQKVHVNLTRVEEAPNGLNFYTTGDYEVVNLGLWTADRLVARR